MSTRSCFWSAPTCRRFGWLHLSQPAQLKVVDGTRRQVTALQKLTNFCRHFHVHPDDALRNSFRSLSINLTALVRGPSTRLLVASSISAALGQSLAFGNLLRKASVPK